MGTTVARIYSWIGQPYSEKAYFIGFKCPAVPVAGFDCVHVVYFIHLKQLSRIKINRAYRAWVAVSYRTLRSRRRRRRLMSASDIVWCADRATTTSKPPTVISTPDTI